MGQLRYKRLFILIFLPVCLGCSDNSRDIPKDILQVSVNVYRSAQPGPEILWRLPPGGIQASLHESRYYVEVEIGNNSERPVEVGSCEAYFAGSQGKVLFIFVLNHSPTIPAHSKKVIRLDTDGYSPDLLRSESKNASLEFFLSVIPREYKFAILPKLSELADQTRISLSLKSTTTVPGVGGSIPMKVTSGEWMGLGLAGPPVIIREQDEQMCIYFYYPTKVLSVNVDEHRPSSGDLWTDFAKIGVREDTEFVTVKETPWPSKR